MVAPSSRSTPHTACPQHKHISHKASTQHTRSFAQLLRAADDRTHHPSSMSNLSIDDTMSALTSSIAEDDNRASRLQHSHKSQLSHADHVANTLEQHANGIISASQPLLDKIRGLREASNDNITHALATSSNSLQPDTLTTFALNDLSTSIRSIAESLNDFSSVVSKLSDLGGVHHDTTSFDTTSFDDDVLSSMPVPHLPSDAPYNHLPSASRPASATKPSRSPTSTSQPATTRYNNSVTINGHVSIQSTSTTRGAQQQPTNNAIYIGGKHISKSMTLEELMTKTGDKRAHEDDSNVNSEDSLSLDDLRNLLLDTDAPEIFSDQQPEQHTRRASKELPAQFTTCLANMTVLSLGTPLKDESQQDSSGSQLKCILEQNGYSKRFYESVLYDIDLANHTVLLAADGDTILGGLIYTNAYVHGPRKTHFLVIPAMVVARAYAQSADQIHAALLQQFIAAAKFATDATHIDDAPRVLIPSPGRLNSTYKQCLETCGLFWTLMGRANARAHRRGHVLLLPSRHEGGAHEPHDSRAHLSSFRGAQQLPRAHDLANANAHA